MRKWMKKLIPMLMGVLLLLGMSANVMAENITAGQDDIVTNEGEVAINGLPTGKEITFNIYRVSYGTYQEESNSFEHKFKDWAKAELKTLNPGKDDEALLEAFINMKEIGIIPETKPDGQDKKEQTEMVNALAAAHPDDANYNVTVSADGIPTGIDGASFNGGTLTVNLPVGSYLILSQCSGMSFLNMLASVNVKEQNDQWMIEGDTLTAKGAELSLAKNVSDTDKTGEIGWDNKKAAAQIGDTLYYELLMDVPVFPVDSPRTVFKVTDTAEHLAINKDSIKVHKVNTGASGDEKGEEITRDAVTAVVQPATEDNGSKVTGSELTVTFNDYFNTFYDRTSHSYVPKVRITYEAELLENADLASENNKNTAYMEYSNDPKTEGLSKSNEDSTNVYTYGLDVKKLAEEDKDKLLPNAEFKIKTEDGGNLKFRKEKDGSYTVVKQETLTEGNVADHVTTDADGTLRIKGLDADVSYTIWESKAPNGYSVNKENLTFKITAKSQAGLLQKEIQKVETKREGEAVFVQDKTPEGSSWQVDSSNYSQGKFKLSIKDTRIGMLPSTGGLGTVLFTVAGVALMCAAVALYMSKRKKDEA